jgi:hypothetical protein
MNFKMLYTFNMQHSIVSRSFIAGLSHKGSFFQSPYPDFYATNVIMLKAKSIVINPVPLVTVGISPKSFGYYYFNDQEKKGIDFLNNLPDAATARRMEHIILPGLTDKTAWLIAMETIKVNYGRELRLQVGYNRYRYLQILYVYGRYARAVRQKDPRLTEFIQDMAELKRKLAWWEKIFYLNGLRLAAFGTKLIPGKIRQKVINRLLSIIGKTPQINLKKSEQHYDTILDVFEKVTDG